MKLKFLPERYQAATASKLYDVEELVDYYFHRRLAAILAVVISLLPIVITPNQITLVGLLFGWVSAWLQYETTFPLFLEDFECSYSWNCAAFFLFLYIVLDCADGQVARLCNRGTRTGRVLDGTVDMLVMIPNALINTLIIWHKYGAKWGMLSVLSGFSIAWHAAVYDKVKNDYMYGALGLTETADETVESVYQEYLEAKSVSELKGHKIWNFDLCLLWWYHKYLLYQSVFFPSEADGKGEPSPKRSPEQLQAFANRHRHVARLNSWLGISAHITCFYVTWAMVSFYPIIHLFLQILFGGILNVLCFWVNHLYITSGMRKSAHS